MFHSIFSIARRFDMNWHDVYDRAVDGVLPPPVFIAGYARWDEKAIQDWLAKGCPEGVELTDAAYETFQEALLAELKNDEKSERKINDE